MFNLQHSKSDMYIQHEILVIYWGAEEGHNYWQFIPLYGKKVNISTLCQYIDTAGQSGNILINFSFVSSIRLINVFWSEFGQNFYEIGSEFGQNFALFSIFEGQNSKNFLWQHCIWSLRNILPSPYSII